MTRRDLGVESHSIGTNALRDELWDKWNTLRTLKWRTRLHDFNTESGNLPSTCKHGFATIGSGRRIRHQPEWHHHVG